MDESFKVQAQPWADRMTCGDIVMKAGELIDLLIHYSDDDEIEVYETISGCYVDTTADIAAVKCTCSLVFRIDVEAGRLRKPLR